MLKRLMIVIAFLLPLVPLLAFSAASGTAANELAAVEHWPERQLDTCRWK
jgi:hypothetical protein